MVTRGRGDPSPPPTWAGLSIWLAGLALLISIMARVNVVDLDAFHQMALFREALSLGFLPKDDVFSYTATVSPSVHHEWGNGAVLYLVTVGLGLGATGLGLLRVALLAGTAVLCWKVARSRGARNVDLALAAPLGILLFWPGLSPVRAHMFTFLFLAGLLWILEAERRGRHAWLLLWPLLFVVWLNLHGGVVVGVGMLGLYSAERFAREVRSAGARAAFTKTWHLWLATGSCVPLVLVNPYGIDYLPYLWHALLLDRPFIPEWGPLWSEDFRGAPLLLFLASLLVVAYSALRGPGWATRPGIVLLMAAALMAFRSVRILPIYSVVFMAYVPAALSGTPVSTVVRAWWERRARWIAAAALVLAISGGARALATNPFTPVIPTDPPNEGQAYPAGAVAYLSDAGFEGNLMTPFGVGAFVSWYLHPSVKVGLDSRFEVAYDPAFVEEAIRVYSGYGEWRALLERHGTDAVLVASNSPLDSLLLAESGPDQPSAWKEVYRDDAYGMFARGRAAESLIPVDRRGEVISATFP